MLTNTFGNNKLTELLLLGSMFLVNGCATAQPSSQADDMSFPRSMKIFTKTMPENVTGVAIQKDGSHIFVSDMSGNIYGLDKTGKELWKYKDNIADNSLYLVKILTVNDKFSQLVFNLAKQEFFNASSATWFYGDYNHPVSKEILSKLPDTYYYNIDASLPTKIVCGQSIFTYFKP